MIKGERNLYAIICVTRHMIINEKVSPPRNRYDPDKERTTSQWGKIVGVPHPKVGGPTV